MGIKRKLSAMVATALVVTLLSGMSVHAFASLPQEPILGGEGRVTGSVNISNNGGTARTATADTFFQNSSSRLNNTIIRVDLRVTDVATGRVLFNNGSTTLSPAFTNREARITAFNLNATSTRGVTANSTHSLSGPVSWSRTLSTTR
jgi:curli biogenesis system outer membrane secretion channel CsgG